MNTNKSYREKGLKPYCRIWAFFLCLLCVAGMLPNFVFAESAYVDGFTVDAAALNGEYLWPLPSSETVSQGYGEGIHNALDIAAPEDTEVIAAQSGTVSSVQYWDGETIDGEQSYGNKIEITHEDGNITYYAHLSGILVNLGVCVNAGDVIGKVGETGNATGPHLHFEVVTPAGKANPMDYFIAEQVTVDTSIENSVVTESVDNVPDEPVQEETGIGESYVQLGMGGIALFSTAQKQGTLTSTGDINVLTNAPDTATFGSIGTLMNKMMEYPDGSIDTAYCIQHGVDVNYPEEYENVSDLIPNPEHRDLVGDALAYGFKAADGRIDSVQENSEYAATQLLIWEILADQFHTEQARKDVLTCLDYAADPDTAKAYYNNLVDTLQNKYRIPSFSASYPGEAKPITLKWDGSKYSATVTDSNGALSKFDWSDSRITITKSGNNLTISSDGPIAGSVTVKATFEALGGSEAVIAWKNKTPGRQNVATGWNATDPVNAYIKVKTDAVGSAGLLKTSEDGDVAGKSFRFTGSDGSSVTKTTDSNGHISLDGLPIYVTEMDEETGEKITGERITYTATEINVPVKYVVPQSQTFQLSEGTEVSLEFENRLKKWRVTVTKKDAEMGTAQGDATLGGAVYGIYHNGALEDTYTTDASGKFTTSYYLCGTGWTLKEITPSEGYLLNGGNVAVGLAPGETTVEYNSTTANVTEQVIKGKIGITKHTDQGETGIETPETGAEFQVFLSASGSYDKAKPTERATIVIDEHGYGETPLLPYGTYTVTQTKGWDGKEKITDFQVKIDQDGKLYSFIINNRIFEANIQIVKKDAETGRVIPASGVGFKIKEVATGKYITQHINYPTPTDITVFYTNVTGKLMLPEPLTYGEYDLIEQCSAYGYVLDGTPVRFTVDGTAKTVEVEMFNTPQKGKVIVKKTGEVFSTVKESDGVYTPVYEVKGLPGAVYDVIANEAIKTPDGTLRYARDEVVDTITTNDEGVAESKLLYLGKYRVVERKAPDGMVLNTEPVFIEFSYAGQEIPIITEDVGFYNERQKAKISLQKALEQDEAYGVGMNGEYQNIRFGLFADEDIKAADGSVLPKDGLIEQIGLEESFSGTFTADVPMGRYYVQEVATDSHYLISEKKYPLDFSYQGQDTALVEIKAHDGEPIENILKRGKIIGCKSDEDGLLLAEAVIGIFKPEETEFTENTAIALTKSTLSGDWGFENIPCGKWLVHEVEAPTGFLLSDQYFPVEITEDGQVIEIFMENYFIRGGLKIYKVDSEKPGRRLTGAEFSVYADSNGNKEFDEGDVFVGKTEEVKHGIHVLEDLRYGGYFYVETKAPEYYHADETPVYFEIRDQDTVCEFTHGNAPIKGRLKVIKSSEDGIIAGRTFLISGTSYTGDEYSQEFVTDENGEINVSLRAGEYTVHEVGGNDTKQYILPEDQTVIIGDEKEAVIQMVNKLKRGNIKIMKDSSDGRKDGFTFEVKSADGTYCETFTSEKTGIIIAEGLRIGKYTVTEVRNKASEDYILPDAATFEVKTGETVLVQFFNEKPEDKPKTPTTPTTPSKPVPQTGDDYSLYLYIGLMGLAVIGSGASVFVYVHRGRGGKVNPRRRKAAGLAMLICVGLAVGSAFLLAREISQYRQSADAYAGLTEYVDEQPQPTPPATDSGAEAGGLEETPEAGGEDEPAASSVVLPAVNFAALCEKGPDVAAWLTLEGTVINYPVTQAENNTYYLKHLYDGTQNKAGCLFLDYENAPDFADNNTIIYGHNMRDGSMFSSLLSYAEQDYYDAHPSMLLMTPEGGYVVELFTAFVASPNEASGDASPWALDWKDDGTYTTWLADMQGRSLFQSEVSVTSSDHVLTLSTCTSSGKDRFIVMGKLVEVTQ